MPDMFQALQIVFLSNLSSSSIISFARFYAQNDLSTSSVLHMLQRKET